jgi:hypothetical protein
MLNLARICLVPSSSELVPTKQTRSLVNSDECTLIATTYLAADVTLPVVCRRQAFNMLQDKSIVAHDLCTHFEGDLICAEPKVTIGTRSDVPS